MLRSVPRRMESIAPLVGLVREFLSHERLPETMEYDLQLVIEELFSNLVRHGTSGSDRVDVSLDHHGDDVVLELREFDADRFDPTTVPAPDTRRPLVEREPGGLGIHFVRIRSRAFHYDWRGRVGTTTVTLETRR
jgi:anti-sigma regulatory factor (Ser/Thr protein kinase)